MKRKTMAKRREDLLAQLDEAFVSAHTAGYLEGLRTADTATWDTDHVRRQQEAHRSDVYFHHGVCIKILNAAIRAAHKGGIR